MPLVVGSPRLSTNGGLFESKLDGLAIRRRRRELIKCSLAASWCVHDNYLALVPVLIADERD